MMMEQKHLVINTEKQKTMKNTLITSILLLSLISCKAQTIVPIFSTDDIPESSNYYHKDVANDLNKFEGTWKYIDASTNTEFIIELQKKTMVNDNDGSYIYDTLIGEYFYKQNNIIITNTLADINNTSITVNSHKISGYSILHKYDNPHCDTCTTSERRTQLIISHPTEKDVMGYLTLRHIVDNGVEKLEAKITNASISGYTQASFSQMPFGSFVFVKQ
jgi:hypothetical protein